MFAQAYHFEPISWTYYKLENNVKTTKRYYNDTMLCDNKMCVVT